MGNVPLKLHDWNVDFAVWCTYKYLNGGYGGVGGVFVHSNHFEKEYLRLDGWWGNRIETRFNMRTGMIIFIFFIIDGTKYVYLFFRKTLIGTVAQMVFVSVVHRFINAPH